MKIEKGGSKMIVKDFWEDQEKGILKPNLFSVTAKIATEVVHNEGEATKINSPTQIRKFYDEVIRYKTQCLTKDEDFFKQKLPYIKMINAKLSYSKARGHIGPECCKLFSDLIGSVKNKKEFLVFADFFEAFIAYYRQYENKKNK